ncbi:MAG: glycosyltransferase family 9 protein [Candidatus Brocadiia bacterium]
MTDAPRLPSRPPDAPSPEGPLASAQRIGIVRLSAIGDVVNTLPALAALRRQRPDAHVAWVCERAAAGLLEGHPQLDNLVVVDRKAWTASLAGLARMPRALWAFARTLRSLRLDATVDFQGNLRSGIATFLTRAPLRAGFAVPDAREFSHLLTNRHVGLPPGPLHRVERGLHLLTALGVETGGAAPLVPATDADRGGVGEFLAREGLADASFAAIHAGTSEFGRYKQWPQERWGEVARRLADDLGLPVVCTRGPDPGEARGAQAIARGAGPAARAAPLLSLRELGELYRRCRLFLGVDTGPMHLASAVGAPVVALFGPKDSRVYGPYFGPRAIVEKPLACRPCRRRSCDDPQCMLSITPEDVLAAARELVEST